MIVGDALFGDQLSHEAVAFGIVGGIAAGNFFIIVHTKPQGEIVVMIGRFFVRLNGEGRFPFRRW